MKNIASIGILITAPLVFSACTTTPEPELEKITPPEIVETCYPITSLEKVVVPAVTRSGHNVISIENPPEYYVDPDTGKTVEITLPPTEKRTPYTKVVTPESFYYKTVEGERTTDICELNEVKPTPAPTDEAGEGDAG